MRAILSCFVKSIGNIIGLDTSLTTHFRNYNHSIIYGNISKEEIDELFV